MRTLVQKTEAFLEWGGIKKEITLLAISGVALVVSIFDLLPLPFDAAWVAIVLCGIPIVLEALIGLITAFDIKADVLVSLALIAAVLIGEDFAAGEVAFIMQLGGLLEDLTVAKARAGIEKLVGLTPRTARRVTAAGEESIPAKAVATREEAIAKKGILCESAKCEGDRCLTCNVVCQVCADVCPNRANVVIELPDGRQQILHVDRMCNASGSSSVFCPYDSAPYRDKFTLFQTREGFDESVNNQGFLPLGGKKVLVRLDSKVFEADLDAKNDLPADIEVFIWTVLTKYAYLVG